MSKEKRTAKEKLLAKVAAIQQRIASAGDDELKAWADQLDAGSNLKSEADQAAAAEKEVAQQSTGVDTGAAADDQNARSNANWPMNWSGKAVTAATLVKLARRDAKTAAMMLADAQTLCADDEDDEDDCAACKAAAEQLRGMAASRKKTASDMMKLARGIMGDDDDDEDGDDKPDWLKEKMEKGANTKVASRLIALAKQVMADDDDDDEEGDGEEEGKEVAAALINLAKTLADNE